MSLFWAKTRLFDVKHPLGYIFFGPRQKPSFGNAPIYIYTWNNLTLGLRCDGLTLGPRVW